MTGLGTVVNAALVIVGGSIGLFLKKGIPQKMQDTLMQALGVSTIFIGISGTLQGLFKISGNELKTEGTLLIIFSLVLGGFVGSWIDIEQQMEDFGTYLREKLKREGDSNFLEGFINTSLVICIGAMAIVGSLQDGLYGDISMLVAKACLDGVVVLIFASIFGIGAICSVIPLVALQGGVTLLAHLLQNILTEMVIQNLSFVGSTLIFCVGINLIFGNKIKVANLLPALLWIVLFSYFL